MTTRWKIIAAGMLVAMPLAGFIFAGSATAATPAAAPTATTHGAFLNGQPRPVIDEHVRQVGVSGMFEVYGTITNDTKDSDWTLSGDYVVSDDGHMGVQPAQTLDPGQQTTFSSYGNDPFSGDDTQVVYQDQWSNTFYFEAQNLPTSHDIDGTTDTSSNYAINGSISGGYDENATFTAVGATP